MVSPSHCFSCVTSPVPHPLLQDDSLESIQHCLVRVIEAVEDATTKVVDQRESCMSPNLSPHNVPGELGILAENDWQKCLAEMEM